MDLNINKKQLKIILATVFTVILVTAGALLWPRQDAPTARAGWWNDNWTYRKALVINHAQVAGDLTNFPVLVSLTDSNLGTHAQEDGDDIKFILHGTSEELKHEIESFATSTGELVCWVKIPALSSADDTVIYMYYGNSSVGSQQDGENVWDGNYAAVWHLPDDNTASGTDSTKNSNDGTAMNTASTTNSGQIDGAFQLDGNSDYIKVNDKNNLNFATSSDLSVSMWFRIATTSGLQCFTSKYNANGTGAGWFIRLNSGTIDTRIDDDINAVHPNFNTISKDNTWHQLYMTVDRSEANGVKIYYDGTEQGCSGDCAYDLTTVGNLSNARALGIGTRDGSDPGFYYNGLLDEVRISNTARSLAWIETSYNNQNSPASFFAEQAEETGPGPVGYWTFDTGHGATAYDESGQGNNGAITGASWQSEDMCVSGKCLYFDGTTSNYVKIGSSTKIDDSTEGTMSAWVKYSTVSTLGAIFAYGGGDINSIRLGIKNTNGSNYINILSKNNQIRGQTVLSSNIWYYLSAVSDGSTFILYVNGTEEAKVGLGGSDNGDWFGNMTTTEPDETTIGIRKYEGSLSYPFHGFIDEVKIYPYARSADEIKMDYAAGLAGVKSSKGVSVSFGSQSDSWMSDGLVGYWQMDESATTSGAIDASGNGNNGTYYGDASTTAGKFGNGGSFDGGGDYIDTGNLALGTTHTISVWINSDGLGGDFRTVLGDNDSTGDYVLRFLDSNRTRYATHWDNYVNFGGSNPTTGVWEHWVITRNGTTVLLYENGVKTGSEILDSDYDLYISRIGILGSVDAFDGKIDEVRIYNRALSADEVKKLYEWAPGPVAHWKFDEKTGQTAYDSAASTTFSGGNHGELGGGTASARPTWSNFGKYGSALEFDGSNDRVEVADNVPLDIGTNDFSVAFWTKVNEFSWYSGVGKGSYADGETCWYVGFSNTGIPNIVINDGTNKTSPGIGSALNINTWYHMTYVFDRDDFMYVYTNGSLHGSTDMTSYQRNLSNSYALLVGQYSGFFFNGLIDDVRIYNYARTQKQILQDMNAGRPAHGQPVLHLKFDKGTGATAYDSNPMCVDHKTNCNNGTLYPGTGGTNTASSAMWSLDGKWGGAMEFDGDDDYVAFSSISQNQITVSVWIYPTTNGDSIYPRIVEMPGYLLLINRNPASGPLPNDNSLEFVSIRSTNGDWFSAPETIQFNQWYYVATTYDSSSTNNNPKLYINGIEVNSYKQEPLSGSQTNNAGTGYIGNRLNKDRSWDGLIDEVKIWNYALTAEEIEMQYNRGQSAIMGSVSTATSTPSAGSGQVTHVPSHSAASKYCVPGSTDHCAPPVLELKMDEKGGTTTYDTSGQGNDGVFVNTASSPTWQGSWACKYGACLEFDGVDDQISINDTNDSLDGIGAVTLSLWFYPHMLNAGWHIIAGKSNSAYNYGLWHQGNQFVTTFYNGDWKNHFTVGSYSINQWYHLTTVIDNVSDTTRIYVNGVDDTASSSETADMVANNESFYFTPSYNSRRPDGLIDYVKIYNYARTPAQIAWDYNRGEPIAEWRFDECKGGTIYDESGNGNHGTLQLGTTGVTATGTCASSSDSFWYNGGPPAGGGKVNRAGSFDGGDDYVSIPDVLLLEDSNWSGKTVSLWAKADVLPSDHDDDMSAYSHFSSNPAERAFNVEIDRPSNKWGASTNSINGWARASNAIIVDTWYHVTGVWSAGNYLKLYINGVLVDIDNSVESSLDNSPNPHIIGGRHNVTIDQEFYGDIDEVKIFNYALTPTQVRAEFNGGAVRFGE